MARVLVIDDEENMRMALGELLKSWGHEVVLQENYTHAMASLKEQPFDMALCDVKLPDGSGLDLVKELRENSIVTPVVLLTGYANIEDAVLAIRLGAEDYLSKPVEPPRLKILLDKTAERRDMEEEVRSLRRQLRRAGTVGSLVGKSAVMQELYTLIERVATTDAAVFITGESGTGKTLIAKTIHEYSKRRKRPFVAVNCAAIAPTLIESELFGHEKGAFTGATQQRRGFFEEANGGTIFLDEISELPIELQGKLLRVLEENRVRRVGGNQEFDINVRLISATNRDPKDAIREGKLREDLYYRINIFPIHAPSLRERPDDVPFLAQMFLEKICEDEGRSLCHLEPRVIEIMKKYEWPGNVRELRNAVNRAVIVARGDAINIACLPDYLKKGIPEAELAAAAAAAKAAEPLHDDEQDQGIEEAVGEGEVPGDKPPAARPAAGYIPPMPWRDMTLDDMEKAMIEQCLKDTANNKPLVAEKLGISLKTLYNKIKKYGVS